MKHNEWRDRMNREKLVQQMLQFMPQMHKKIFKDFHKGLLTKEQMGLMFCLQRHGKRPMHFFGEHLMISKPNLSVLVKKLEGEGLVERIPNEEDRREIYIDITNHGRNFLKRHQEEVKKILLERFEVFSDGEVDELTQMFERIQEIMERLG